MEDFKTIKSKDSVFGEYLICNHCGERVERGISTVSAHWVNCLKRTDGLIIAKNEFDIKVLDSLSINVVQ